MLGLILSVVQDLLEGPCTVFAFLLFFYEGTYVVVVDDLVNTGSIGGCLELYSLRVLLELSLVFLD